MGLCLCSLILVFREQGDLARYLRILLTAMIGMGVLVIAFVGMGHKPTSLEARPFYAIMFLSIILLGIACYLAYREYGHHEI